MYNVFSSFEPLDRSILLQKNSPLANLLQGGGFFNFSLHKDSSINQAKMASFLKNIFGMLFPSQTLFSVTEHILLFFFSSEVSISSFWKIKHMKHT